MLSPLGVPFSRGVIVSPPPPGTLVAQDLAFVVASNQERTINLGGYAVGSPPQVFTLVSGDPKAVLQLSANGILRVTPLVSAPDVLTGAKYSITDGAGAISNDASLIFHVRAPRETIDDSRLEKAADLRLTWRGFDSDISVDAGDLVAEDGLKTAVILSLFLDRRADPDDAIPDGTGDLRGSWMDAFPVVTNDLRGSKLWLLAREKDLQSVLNRAREYAQEALEWMIEDGIAENVTVDAESQGNHRLALSVSLIRPDGRDIQYRFQLLWEAEHALQ